MKINTEAIRKNIPKLLIRGGGLLGFCILLYLLFSPGMIGAWRMVETQKMIRLYVKQIVEAEEAYFSTHGTYIAAQPHPHGRSNGNHRTRWKPGKTHGFTALQWSPTTSAVFCRYGVNATTNAYTVEVECDVFRDKEFAYLGYVKPAPGVQIGISGPFNMCFVQGIYVSREDVNAKRFEEIGPCNAHSAIRLGLD